MIIVESLFVQDSSQFKEVYKYLLDYWRCRCKDWAAAVGAGSATRWMDSAWIPEARQSLIQRVLVVLLQCCSHEMTLHVFLICCEQNASKLLFRFSFRPFFSFFWWVNVFRAQLYFKTSFFFGKIFLFLFLSQFSSWIWVFALLAFFSDITKGITKCGQTVNFLSAKFYFSVHKVFGHFFRSCLTFFQIFSVKYFKSSLYFSHKIVKLNGTIFRRTTNVWLAVLFLSKSLNKLKFRRSTADVLYASLISFFSPLFQRHVRAGEYRQYKNCSFLEL